MALYENYKVKSKKIGAILEDSANRYNSSAGMVKFNANDNRMSFAYYYSSYHPFLIDTNINRYFQNGITTVNKGYIHRGGAPLLIERSPSISLGGTTIIYSYSGSGDGTDYGTIYTKVVTSSETIELNPNYNCPSSAVFGIIGAGGGGAGGGGWWTGKTAYGGGCGPLLLFNLEFPYKQTERTEILKVELGAGGSGGGPWSDGSDGGQTKVYFKKNGSWILVATLNGGRGGENKPYDGNTIYAPSTELAITTLTFNQPINNSTISNGDGYGKITVNQSCRSFGWGSGTYAYMPGNYYDHTMDDSYNQASYHSVQVTSSDIYGYSNLYKGGYTYGYGEKGSRFATNRMYYGKTSIYYQGGSYPNQGVGNGGQGYWGSGGGGGGSAQNLFDGGIGSGGKGGDAGIKVYW